ncbi:MAG: ADOP family duplicated permease, partial [Bryobacteraceae bacterium]
MEHILTDGRYAARQLLRSPRFTVSVVFTIALALGAATLIFSVVEGVLLRPLPFFDPGRLVTFHEDVPTLGGDWSVVPAPDVVAFSREARGFAAVGGSITSQAELSGVNNPEQIWQARMTKGAFNVLGVGPKLGRIFTQQEDQQGQTVAVLSDNLWRSRFDSDPFVAGKQIKLDRRTYTVIGVMPPGFEYPLLAGHSNRVQVWIPMGFTHDELTKLAGSPRFAVLGRLGPNVSVAEAEASANRVAREIVAHRPDFMSSVGPMTVHLHGLRNETLSHARPLLQILFLAVMVLVLVACANVAGLLLVRGLQRRREMAVRLALGTTRWALLVGVLWESTLTCALGGVAGVALAALSIRSVVRFLPETLPRLASISLDWRVAGFALAITIATGLTAAVAPAFAANSIQIAEALKEGGNAGIASRGHLRLRSILIVAEIAVAVTLLGSAGLLFRSFEEMRSVDLGFEPENAVSAVYSLPSAAYSKQAQVDRFNRKLLESMRLLPGAQAAGLISALPVSGAALSAGCVPEGYMSQQGNPVVVASWYLVMDEAFRAMGVPLVRGRYLSSADNASAPLAVVVSRSFAEHYWRGQNPIGKHLRLGSPEMALPWLTVVGEVADIKEGAADVPNVPQFYQTVAQFSRSLGPAASAADLHGSSMTLVLRSTFSPSAMENMVRQTVRKLDPQLALSAVNTMEKAVSTTEAPRKFNALLFASFAGGTLLLSMLGV